MSPVDPFSGTFEEQFEEQFAGIVAEVDALLAPVVAVAQQLEALAAQRVEGVRDANPSRTVSTRGS